MHDEIKRFSLEGEIGDNNMVEAKERLITFLEAQLRDAGHVPALDLEPQFTLDYDRNTEKYNFELSIYGIHVGKEQACSTAGVMNGKTITRYIPQTK